MKKSLILCCLMTATWAAHAQQILRGKVLDNENKPLAGVTIALPDEHTGSISADSGTFLLEGLTAKIIHVVFTYSGYKTTQQDFDLTTGSITDAVVKMKDEGLALNDVVVTGVSNPRSKMSSSVSISTLKAEEVQKAAPRTTAEIFRSIPGIRSEASGGDGNTNITVRGVPLSTGGSKYLQLQEDGLPVFQFGDIAFATSDIFLRADQNISRIEAIRGGSASSLATNAPAGIINFISKTGNVEGGSISSTFGLDYKNYRTDFDYGAPIGKGLSFHMGGFYRLGEGPRTAGYNANNGGQFKFNITQQFKGGYARVYVKLLDDRAGAYMPAPVQVTGTNSNPVYQSLPGFNVQRGTLLSPELLQTQNIGADGSLSHTNVADGMHANSKSIGAEFSFDLGDGWKIEDRAKASFNSGSFIAPFPAAAGTTTAILQQIATATGSNLTGANLSYATTGAAYTGTNAMIIHVFNTKLNNFNNFTNDLQLKKKIGKANLLFGMYKATQNIDMNWMFSSHLATVDGNHARLLNITDANGVKMSSGGTFAYGAPLWGNLNRNYNINYDFLAPYAALNYNIAEKIDLDGSIRYDMGSARGSYSGNVQRAYDMNNDGVISADEQSVSAVDYTSAKPVNYNYGYLSYSVGINYLLDASKAVFARYSSGASARADRLLFTPNIFADGTADGKYDRLDQAELGFKLKHKIGSLFVTGFYAKTNEAVNYEVFGTTTRVIKNSYRSLGAEVEGILIPVKNMTIRANGTYTHARIIAGTYDGKTPRRQAAFIYGVTPTYDISKLSIGFSAIGTTSSYTQNDNILIMPGYVYVNPFIAYQFTPRLRASVNANNVFNTMGFTEAEESSITENTNNIIRARSITGRSTTATIGFSF